MTKVNMLNVHFTDAIRIHLDRYNPTVFTILQKFSMFEKEIKGE